MYVMEYLIYHLRYERIASHFHFPSLCHYDIMTFIVIVIVSITFLNNRAVEAEKTDDTELVAKVLP